MVKAEGLRKSYGNVEAVRGVSLEVDRGQVVVVIGPSGCGKSTFLRCINLLEEPSAGTLQVGDRRIDFGAKQPMPRGRDLARFRARIGMVFQQFDLFPHMTALQNVMSGPVIVKKLPKSGEVMLFCTSRAADTPNALYSLIPKRMRLFLISNGRARVKSSVLTNGNLPARLRGPTKS